jgi:hypothetical protein
MAECMFVGFGNMRVVGVCWCYVLTTIDIVDLVGRYSDQSTIAVAGYYKVPVLNFAVTKHAAVVVHVQRHIFGT